MTSSGAPAAERPRPAALYGRRRGPRLRARRRALLAGLLPKLRVDLSASVRIADARAAFGAGPAAPLWLEIGFGGGEHLAWQAARRPDATVVGCEAYLNGIASLLARVEDGGLANVRVFPDDARALVAALPGGCLERVFVLFPDPWPKRRHHRRRLLQAAFVDDLARVMAPGAELRLATDHPGYCRWILARLLPHPAFAWTARTPADWRTRPDASPETRYEQKARHAGRRAIWLRFLRR